MVALANLTTYFAGESASLLSSIEKSRGGLKSLLASLDPVAAATAKFNAQMKLLENSFATNRLSADQYQSAIAKLGAKHEQFMAGQRGVTASSGQMRAGMQQLSFQIGDVATQFASGTKPMIIFAQQSGQIIQALSLMTTKATGLLGFLGGPWGMIITAATIVLAPFIAKLFEAADTSKLLKDRLELAADGADAFGDAQSILGQMVDLTTGKLKTHNDVLRATIRLQAMLSLEQGKTGVTAARKAIGNIADERVGGFGSITPGGTGIGPASEVRFVSPEARDIARAYLGHNIGLDQAIQQLETLRQSGKATQKVVSDLQTQFVEFGQSREKGAASQAILDYLDGKGLDPRLVPYSKPKKEKKGPKDQTDQREERYDKAMAQIMAERLDLENSLSTDLRERAGIAHQQVDAEVEAYRVELEHSVAQKEITAERAKSLMTEKQANAERQHALINRRLDDQLDEQDRRVKRAGLDNANALLNGQLEQARTQQDRRRIQLQILANETELAKETQRAVIASHESSEIEKRIAEKRLMQLDKLAVQRGEAIDRNTQGPLGQYLQSMPKTIDELNESFERVTADGLQSLNDGLADAIANSKSLGDVFKNVANQIVADLLRIAIQEALIKPLAEKLNGGSSGSGGFNLLALFGSGGGAGSKFDGLGDSIGSKLPGFASGGSLRLGGLSGIDKNVVSLNNMPVARTTLGETMTISPANDRGGNANGNGPIELHIYGDEAANIARIEAVSSGVFVRNMGTMVEANTRASRYGFNR